MHRKFAGALVAASLSVLGCSSTGAASKSTDSRETVASLSQPDARERLHAADVAMSEAVSKSGSAQGMAAFLADDAVMLENGQYALRGREAIRAYLAATPLEKGGTLRWEPVRWDVSADGRLGYSVGTTTVEAPGKDGAPERHFTRDIAAWRWQADGTWRVAALVHSPASGPLAPPTGFAATPTSAAPPAGKKDPGAVLAEAFAADSAFSALSLAEGMGRAFVTYAAEDAMMLNGRTGLFGREAITKAYGPITREQVELRWEPALGDAASSGDLAYTIGRATSVSPGKDGKPETDYVHYLTVWRRQADGTWRYVTDGGNTSPGPNGP